MDAGLKIIITVIYILSLLIFARDNLFVSSLFVFYPVIMTAFAELSFIHILKRALLALPFAAVAAFSNIFFAPNLAKGLCTFVIIILRTIFSTWSVIILIGTTPFHKISFAMKKLHIPQIFVMLLEMTYRYIAVLLDEVFQTVIAYKLRSAGRTEKSVSIKHFGKMVANLFVRSFDRASRIYDAMKCRGYGDYE
ncbi:MAG: cobalt ECF transporter T component CbiQ [Treponema sp.]|nr:cobalt ECF transporter T component CbiQ [Treponema sp.]